VHGIDLSPDMVAELRAKPGTDDIGVTIGDFATARVEATYTLAYLVRNTIMNLTTQDGQVACFQNVAAHLEPGGRFVSPVPARAGGAADPAIDPVAEGEADVAPSAFLGEPVGDPGRVGADQQLGDREAGSSPARWPACHCSGSWSMAARVTTWSAAQLPRRRPAGTSRPAPRRSRPASPRADGVPRCACGSGRRPLVGPGAHDRGVQIDDRLVSVGPGAGLPRGGPGHRSGTGETAQLGGSQRVEGPLHVPPGRHRPDQVRLARKASRSARHSAHRLAPAPAEPSPRPGRGDAAALLPGPR
jgi:hypothetical protein